MVLQLLAHAYAHGTDILPLIASSSFDIPTPDQYDGAVQYGLLGFEIDVSTSRTVLEYGTPLDIARSV